MAQWVKDPTLSLLSHRFDPWPLELPHAKSEAKKKKKKKKNLESWQTSPGLVVMYHENMLSISPKKLELTAMSPMKS